MWSVALTLKVRGKRLKKKLRIAIIFGGKSSEHEVSIASASSIFHALDKSKYDITLVGIDKSGRWLLPDQARVLTHSSNPRLVKLNEEHKTVSLVPFENPTQLINLGSPSSPDESTLPFDVVFPVLHGPHGEDGTIQGLLELANVPYVGAGVLGSALGMDKEVSRRLLREARIPVVPFKAIRKRDFKNNAEKIISEINREFKFPYFVKPANLGSSVGVNKVKNKDEALVKFNDAFLYDTKILVEPGVDARELECAVLGHYEPRASIVGEVIPRHEFYSYQAKYIDENGAELKIPAANLAPDIIERIRGFSIQAFKILECRGMARVDFFLDRKTNELYLNEINTIPGFTKISMYPKLWQASGVPYSQLLDELIRLAIESHEEKNALKMTYEPNDE